MAITEEARHRMYQRLSEVLGPEEASVLMEHLPPVGWADVATKRDLEHLHLQVRLDLSESERRILGRLHSTQLAMAVTVVGAVFGAAALF